MNFDYNEEQQLLADSVRRYLAKDYGFEARRRIVGSAEGWSEEVWRQLAALGLTALPIPAEYGGFGGGAVDLMGPMEAMGEALVVEPLAATLVAARLVERAGSEAQKRAILPAVAEGRLRLAFAHAERGARYGLARVSTRAFRTAAGWTLTGAKAVVVGAPAAAKLVVSAKGAEGLELFVVETAAARLVPQLTLDERRAADVYFEETAAEPLAGGSDATAAIEEATDFATALLCSEAVGAMKYACEATLEYLKTRKQFGVPIGSFQALQHRMVDMFVSCEQARSMACLAASKVDRAQDARERARAVSAAKIRIADAARHVSQEAVQLHGGMGMTEELKVSHTFRRLTVIAREHGDADHHLARFAALDEVRR